ncbi:N-acetylmuramoyl-L-alanine amidase [Falsirhodobacter sp. 1013]|uniref:N-acetylmuramoyl-L-alanine amidase n=1 Tax=Falsirhodobacter sp. 1013 TaxID=3417566 RepID=UPI003EBDC7FE
MQVSRRVWLALALWLGFGTIALAEAQLERGSLREGWGGGVEVSLILSGPAPWRARMLADPPRLVLDFRDTSIAEVPFAPRKRVTAVEAGAIRPGWSRIVLTLGGPYAITAAEMRVRDDATVQVALEPADEAAFRVAALRPEPEEWTLPKEPPPPVPEGDGPLLVMLDPGHGGIDPGAQHDGLTEKALTLSFAQELKRLLVADQGFRVALTREDDRFVPLETRLTLARQAGADVFLSLHADAVREGEATGATLYTLADHATDRAAQIMAAWHDRTDILAGVDLTHNDDTVAGVLMDMARVETAPRTERLARSLESAMKAQRIDMHRHPRQAADFAVLKAPDMPSALVELGFLSSAADRANLRDAAWRARMAAAIRDGLKMWAAKDAAIRPGLRR